MGASSVSSGRAAPPLSFLDTAVTDLLTTDRTLLRPYEPGDVERLLPVLGDATTMAFWPAPLDRPAVTAWVERQVRAFAETALARRVIVRKSDGVVLGDCGVVRAEIAGQPENDLGYIVHHPFQHQGYAIECAAACVEHALRVHGLRRIAANMPAEHEASRRVAQRLGMRLERAFANPRNRGIATELWVLEV